MSDRTPLRATPSRDSGDAYSALLHAASAVAAVIAETPAAGLEGAAAYIHRASAELIAAAPKTAAVPTRAGGAIDECLERLLEAWPRLAQGAIQGEQVIADDPGLWKRAMTEFPMGQFARMAADFLIENDLLGGNVVELGAGVGSCSALVAEHVTDKYIRTDLQPFLLRRQKIAGTVCRYDFNEPGEWRERDAIFAVNAVHCARDKQATLRHLHEMLRPGGMLVLGEGVPYTTARGTPWALNGFFGLFRGWWDVGGFVSRDAWLQSMSDAGFRRTGAVSWMAGEHDLGGVIWAER